MTETPLRRARERAGLTQEGLAARAGVTRQLVGAAEAGRHVPAVDAALRLARALGTSVEALFGSGDAPAPPAAGGLGDGAAVVLARVGSRTVVHPVAPVGDGAWPSADGVVEGGVVRPLPGGATGGFVVVGCDPVLGLCAAMVARDTGRRVLAVPGTTGSALAALAAGTTHAALVHGPGDALPPAPPGVRRLHLARWRVGIGLPVRDDTGALEPLLAAGTPMIQRDAAAASQQALARAAGDRLPPVASRADGHVDAARRAALTGRAAVTFEPAALHHGLGFIPLETHVVQIWIDERWMDHPGAGALLGLLGTDALRARVALVGGYDMEGSGVLVHAA